jgi:hypothetical protein
MSRKLAIAEMVSLACGMVKQIAVTKDRIFTETNLNCQIARRRMLQTASNTTNTTANITAVHRFTVTPDYTAVADTTATLCSTNFVAANFAALLTKAGLTGVTIAGVSVNTTSTNLAPIVPNFALSDPTVSASTTTVGVTL